MLNIHVSIEGVTPILMNRFTEEAEVKVSSGTSAVQLGNKGTPREQAAKKTYSDDKGNLYIPGPNILPASLRRASFTRLVRAR